MQTCPSDCPRRCASPNCHNAETCSTWAEHEKEVAAERKARLDRNNSIDDVRAVRETRYKHQMHRKRMKDTKGGSR